MEYVPHSGLMVCSYCRTPQEGTAKPARKTAALQEMSLDAEYKLALMRAEREIAHEQAKAMDRASSATRYGEIIGSLWR